MSRRHAENRRAGQDDPRTGGQGRSVLLLGTLLAALLLLRKPESLLHPQFWAEDGAVFFQEAFNQGFLKTLVQPAAGYLHSFPRLVAGLSLLFPIGLAPLIFNLAAFLVQLAPGLYLLSHRMQDVIPSFPARALTALAYIAIPAAYETHVNVTNSHWFLTLTATFILVAGPVATLRVRTFETLAAVLFALTGPFSILFLPLVAPRLFRAIRGAPSDHRGNLALIVAAGAVIQAGFAVSSARIGAAPPSGALTPTELATVVSMHTVFNALFGVNGVNGFYRSLSLPAYGSGLVALAFLLCVAIRDRVKPLLILFYLAAASIALSLAFPLNDRRLWLHPAAGPRYFLFACLFIHGTLLHLAFAGRVLRSVGVACLLVAAAGGMRADFFHPRQPDVHWADNVVVFQSLPAGSDFYVPVTPLYVPGLVLRKTSPARGQSPLSRLRPVASRTPADVKLRRPEKVFMIQADNDRFLSVSGWAVDGAAGQPAGGVFVRIDDSLFPAAYGLPAQITVDGRSYTACGFTRLIPVAEIGPGAHRLSLVVVTSDGKGYFQPTPPLPFASSQFFL